MLVTHPTQTSHRTTNFQNNPSYMGKILKDLLPNALSTLPGRKVGKKLLQFQNSNPVYIIDEFQNLKNSKNNERLKKLFSYTCYVCIFATWYCNSLTL